ncbi:MAG: hypothetical protein ACK53Y_07210, partial [bacterium]
LSRLGLGLGTNLTVPADTVAIRSGPVVVRGGGAQFVQCVVQVLEECGTEAVRQLVSFWQVEKLQG